MECRRSGCGAWLRAAAMLLSVGCAGGGATDAGLIDAQFSWPDGGDSDAGTTDAGTIDGGMTDAGPFDSGVADAGSVDSGPGDSGLGDSGPSDSGPGDSGPADAGPIDSGLGDSGVSCPALAAGDTVMLDGTGDLAAFPSEQILAPGAPITAGDQFALTWDRDALYVVVVTDAFMGDGLRPFHLYLETGTTLGAASPSMGKEYDSLTAALDFTPNVLIAFRATNDTGAGEYNGVYAPSGAWTDRSRPLVTGTDLFVRADQGAISVRVPWSALGGCPLAMRVSGHLVHAVPANEWKTLVPTDATPWGPPDAADGGGYYEVDLTSDPAISGWTPR
ncbi:MAG: hypothetical protein AB8I08_28005 [Sandaracinaceae bacterium]